MKTLLLMRHAKAEPAGKLISDEARQLTPRGRADAKRMAAFLAAGGLVPHVILSSPSTRTKQTVDTLLKNFAYAGDVFFYNGLYASSLEEYLAILRSLSDTASLAMLVGHNPIIEEFILQMTGRQERVQTAGIARIQFQLESWASLVDTSPGRLAALWQPKELQ